jgi:hypothetical protein
MGGGGENPKPKKIQPVPQANLTTTGWGGMTYPESAQPQTFTPEAKPAWMQGAWDMPTWGYSPATGQAFSQRPPANPGGSLSLQPGWDPANPTGATPPGTGTGGSGTCPEGQRMGRGGTCVPTSPTSGAKGSVFPGGNLFGGGSQPQVKSMSDLMAREYGLGPWSIEQGGPGPVPPNWASHGTQG